MKKIGTHSGTFHADESLACFLLKQTKQFANAEIIRSRDAKILEGCDVIVDVGGIYDSKIHRYDHHQRGFEETMTIGETKFHTKLSSAGLIYRHFGEEVISNLCQNVKGNSLQVVYKKVYESFIEEFDGVDNGVDRYPADIVPKYQISTTISDRVRRLNPDWNEKSDDLDQRFEKAMELTGKEFVECVKGYAFSWLPARDIVEKSMKKRFEYDSKGSIMVLEQFCPWKSHIYDLEQDQKVLYVIYQDYNASWRVQCVPQAESSFESRKPLPEPWRGIRDEELSTLSGIEGCVFVHASGFIGGTKTLEGALEMAKKSNMGV